MLNTTYLRGIHLQKKKRFRRFRQEKGTFPDVKSIPASGEDFLHPRKRDQLAAAIRRTCTLQILSAGEREPKKTKKGVRKQV